MDLPTGQCVHCLPGRLRIRVRGKRLDGRYLQQVKETLQEAFPQAEIRINPQTGSVLCLNGGCDLEALAGLARDRGLFELSGGPVQTPLAQSVQRSFEEANRAVRKGTRGELDLPTLIFLFLAGTAIYQIGRGNLGLPPWYTAFWYAFGVFTRSLLDSSAAPEPPAK